MQVRFISVYCYSTHLHNCCGWIISIDHDELLTGKLLFKRSPQTTTIQPVARLTVVIIVRIHMYLKSYSKLSLSMHDQSVQTNTDNKELLNFLDNYKCKTRTYTFEAISPCEPRKRHNNKNNHILVFIKMHY